jgi:alkaline phosphatase
VGDRECENEIARQYIEITGVNVILGAGKGVFSSTEFDEDPCGIYGDFILTAEEKGYTVVFNKEDMLKSANKKYLLGLFRYVSLTPAYKKNSVKRADQEPSLSEMTRVALNILEKNEKGFFLVVEGSQIDWANHANNLAYQIGEILEFDRAVKHILDWINLEQSRKENTLIIIVPDHDCGGFAVKGPMGRTFTAPGHYVKEGWICGGHTGEDTIIWSQGPYSEHLGKAIDNTDIFHIMKAAFLGQPYEKVKVN